MLMSNICYGLNINEICVWIADTFNKNQLSIVLNSFLKSLHTLRWLNKSGCNTVIWQGMLEEIVSTAVNSSCSYNMMTLMSQTLNCVRNSCRTWSNRQSSRTALKSSKTLFKNIFSRISQSAIDIACITKSKAVSRMLWIMENIRGCLINRNCTCIGCWVCILLTYMKL